MVNTDPLDTAMVVLVRDLTHQTAEVIQTIMQVNGTETAREMIITPHLKTAAADIITVIKM